MSSGLWGVGYYDGKLHFEIRVDSKGFKLWSAAVKSVEEAALCNDITRLYMDQSAAPGSKRKLTSKLNYPKFSAALQLEVLNVEFTKENKGAIMQAVLRQARVAALALPPMPEREHAGRRAKVKKYSGQDVGSRSVDEGTSSKLVPCSPSRSAKKHLDSAGDHKPNDYDKLPDDFREHSQQCTAELRLKVSERQELEQKEKDMTEDSGVISFQEHGSNQLPEHLARVKRIMSVMEQNYLLEEYKCAMLREKLKGHNMKVISKSLMADGNTMTGRRRTEEEERPPPVSVILAPEQTSGGMPTEVGALCAPPSSTPVPDHVVPENDTTAESAWWEHLDWSEVSKYIDQELDEDARPAKVCANYDAQMQYQDYWSRDLTDELFPASEVSPVSHMRN